MRVKVTPLAISQGMNKGRGRANPGASEGIVIGFGKRDKAMVKIITKGTSTGLIFHMDFWETTEPNAKVSGVAADACGSQKEIK